MVPAGKVLVLPVSCVEAGRWSPRSAGFASAARAQYAEGRARKMAHVTENMKASGRKVSNQGDVWNNISEKFSKFGSHSSTSAMSDLYEQHSIRIEDYVHSFTPLSTRSARSLHWTVIWLGWSFLIRRERFGSSSQIVRSYGLDAISSRGRGWRCPRPSKTLVAEFLKSVADAKVFTFNGVGEGLDLRLEADALTGAALEVDENLIHLSAFRIPKVCAERRADG